jgi:hypothetical protein
LATLVGWVISGLALDHNPQNVYDKNPFDIFWVFYAWFSMVWTPFLLLRHIAFFRSILLSIGFIYARLQNSSQRKNLIRLL